jgi:archaellum biogenesis ATPase FlaH
MGSPTENQDVAGLHKMPTGVEGFDAITGGGLPRNRTSLILGGPGAGKTVFALQTLVNGARQFGEPGIFVALKRTPATFWQTPQASGGTCLNWKGSNSSFLMPRLGLT